MSTPRYIVKTSSAKMPNSCWGRYVHIAVLEVRDGVDWVDAIRLGPKVNRIVQAWYNRQSGGPNSASAAAHCAARNLVVELEADERRPTSWHQNRAQARVRQQRARRERIRAEQARVAT